jgi:hypothetical protein
VADEMRRRWDDTWAAGELLAPEELEACLAHALLQSQQRRTPLSIICAYRADLVISPRVPSEIAAAAAIVVHNLTRPTDYTGVLGDVVVVVLENTAVEGAWVVAERINAALLNREGAPRWRVTPISHAEQFGSARKLIEAIQRLTSQYAA